MHQRKRYILFLSYQQFYHGNGSGNIDWSEWYDLITSKFYACRDPVNLSFMSNSVVFKGFYTLRIMMSLLLIINIRNVQTDFKRTVFKPAEISANQSNGIDSQCIHKFSSHLTYVISYKINFLEMFSRHSCS